MSYYDHATMMTHKLGPWADPRTVDHELRWQKDLADTDIIRRPPSCFGRLLFARLWPRRKRRAAKPEQRRDPA